MEKNQLKINEIVYVAPQKNWSFPLHSHENTAELSLVISGKGTFYALNKHRTIEKGMLVAKNPGISHAEKSIPEDPLEQLCIEIEGVHIEGLPENHVLARNTDPVLNLDDDFPFAVESFRFLQRHFSDEKYEIACSEILSAIVELICAHSPASTAQGAKRKNSRQLAADAIAYLDEHYREKIKIEDLARHFFVSEGNLSRQFKALSGYTIGEYLISKRMGEAQRLLLFEDMDIKDAALLCGYDDIQYFYHVFKRYAHCTPAEFREKYRAKDSMKEN